MIQSSYFHQEGNFRWDFRKMIPGWFWSAMCLRGPWPTGQVMCLIHYLLQRGNIANAYGTDGIAKPTGTFFMLVARFNPQDNLGSEVSLPSLHGCMWLQITCSWVQRWMVKESLTTLTWPEPWMGPGRLGTISCWWQIFRKCIRVHTAEVVNLWFGCVCPPCSRKPGLVPLSLTSREDWVRAESRSSLKPVFLPSFVKKFWYLSIYIYIIYIHIISLSI